MTTHSQVPDVVKVDDPCDTIGVRWLYQKPTNHNVRTAWLVDNCGAKSIVLFTEYLNPIRK
jgi:hypothetical protein